MLGNIARQEKIREKASNERWAAFAEVSDHHTEAMENALHNCLHSNDLVAERARADGRVTALKMDIESLSADQMRNLKSMMGAQVYKVVNRIEAIQRSFDNAMKVMKKHLTQIKDDFDVHKEEAAAERKEKLEMRNEIADARADHAKYDAKIRKLQASAKEVGDEALDSLQ